MDKMQRTISKYYEILTRVYATRLACIDCPYLNKSKLYCFKHSEQCATRLYNIMKKLLKE